jgi:hypothetical protein
MPLLVWDIVDRAPVMHPEEIEAGRKICAADHIDYVPSPFNPAQVIPLAAYVEALQKRWQRACQTARIIEAIKGGYCTITPNTGAPSSDARH